MHKSIFLFCSLFFCVCLWSQEPSYHTLLLAQLDNGTVQLQLYQLAHEASDGLKIIRNKTICIINLNDIYHIYNTLLCAQDNQKIIVIHSAADSLVGAYSLHWDLLTDSTDPQIPVGQAAVDIVHNDDQHCLNISFILDEQPVSFSITPNSCPQSACACLLPAQYFALVQPTQGQLSLIDACRNGIVNMHTQTNIIAELRDENQEEMELDATLDAMVEDGVIGIQQVSRISAFFRNIGSSLLVKYLAVKKWLSGAVA